jgi:hypothetical protein
MKQLEEGGYAASREASEEEVRAQAALVEIVKCFGSDFRQEVIALNKPLSEVLPKSAGIVALAYGATVIFDGDLPEETRPVIARLIHRGLRVTVTFKKAHG